MAPGTLFIVSTPIGNLEDVTARAVRILGEVESVLAEDTRRTGILLRHLGLRTPMVSLHQHNERERESRVLERLGEGANLALVSDAGTPLVSDPGERLVSAVRDAGYDVVPIPGPSAVTAALVASGLPAVPFAFLGFPPRKGKDRAAFLERVRGAAETVVLFESPERTARFLSELDAMGEGERPAAVARELTKLHEEVRRGTVGELARYYTEAAPRGEVTLVIASAFSGEGAGGVAGAGADGAAIDEAAIRALGRALVDQGIAPSRAAREVARRLGVGRNQAYAVLQADERPEEDSR
jgi:16S rRNA (cytidine1402-2'-O)-methyltransferase